MIIFLLPTRHWAGELAMSSSLSRGVTFLYYCFGFGVLIAVWCGVGCGRGLLFWVLYFSCSNRWMLRCNKQPSVVQIARIISGLDFQSLYDATKQTSLCLVKRSGLELGKKRCRHGNNNHSSPIQWKSQYDIPFHTVPFRALEMIEQYAVQRWSALVKLG